MAADQTSIAKHPLHFLAFLFVCLVTPWNLIAMWINKPECTTCKRKLGPWEAYNSPVAGSLLYQCPKCRAKGSPISQLERKLFRL